MTIKAYKNTDSLDIQQKCLGISVFSKTEGVNNSRGLHIQIRHNGDKATYKQAIEIQNIIEKALNSEGGLG